MALADIAPRAVDPYTIGHSERVADLACELAADRGFRPRSMIWFRIGALLHDIGKIAVPAEILSKPGPLTKREREQMNVHPLVGEKLLADLGLPWDLSPMIRHHHERWDGTGYPDQLKGDEIPLNARILTIADVYDALTTTRSYRGAHTANRAVEIMLSESGSTLDPVLLQLFLTRTLPRRRRLVPTGGGAPYTLDR
jgi:putative nucleotidyltransferase with HDIG domain